MEQRDVCMQVGVLSTERACIYKEKTYLHAAKHDGAVFGMQKRSTLQFTRKLRKYFESAVCGHYDKERHCGQVSRAPKHTSDINTLK